MFAFEKLLDDLVGERNWVCKQDYTYLIYELVSHSAYEADVMMKTLEIATKGKIKYVK